MTTITDPPSATTFNVRRDDAIKLIYSHKNIWVWFNVGNQRWRYVRVTRKNITDLLRDDLGANDTVSVRRIVGDDTNLFIGE